MFGDGTAGGNYGVVWRPTDGSPIVRLGEGNDIDWSPDETWVLANIFSPPQLVLYPVGAGEPVRLKRGTIAEYQTALWFPDGKSLLVIGNEPGKPTRVFRQDVPDGEPTPVLEERIFPAAITPDGKTVLAIDREQKWRWYPLNGGGLATAEGMTPKTNPSAWLDGAKTAKSCLFAPEPMCPPASIVWMSQPDAEPYWRKSTCRSSGPFHVHTDHGVERRRTIRVQLRQATVHAVCRDADTLRMRGWAFLTSSQ